MSVRSRVQAVEDRMGFRSEVCIPIFWDGRNEDLWRERVEEARRCGYRMNIIIFGVDYLADTVEEANVIVARHKDLGERTPVTVSRRESRGSEILAEWDPGLPAWLRSDESECHTSA